MSIESAAVFLALGDVDQTDGCWLWGGRVHTNGYGEYSSPKQARSYAHRRSYELHIGPIAEDECVCHRCDVPLCVRPDHLFLGTHDANARDMRRKGRGKNPPLHLGERQHLAKLTAANVANIRQSIAAGESVAALAAYYRVTSGTISHIKNGRNWKVSR